MSAKVMQSYQYLMQIPNKGEQNIKQNKSLSYADLPLHSLYHENCICKTLEAASMYRKRLQIPEFSGCHSAIGTNLAAGNSEAFKSSESSNTNASDILLLSKGKQIGQIHNQSLTTAIGPGQALNLCDLCKKTFSTKGNLQNHHVVHSGHKPHECSICKKTFSQRSTLGKHHLIHTGEKPHICSICQRGFRQANNLRIHFLTHSGIKPHECSVCQRRFTQKIALQKHMLTHTGVKPHQCNVCRRQFTTKGNLQKHFLTHTGEKPHICGVCNRGFSQKIALKKHNLTHTGEKPHTCSVCNKGFTTKGNLKSHFQRHSRDKSVNSHLSFSSKSIARSLLVPPNIAESILQPSFSQTHAIMPTSSHATIGNFEQMSSPNQSRNPKSQSSINPHLQEQYPSQNNMSDSIRFHQPSTVNVLPKINQEFLASQQIVPTTSVREIEVHNRQILSGVDSSQNIRPFVSESQLRAATPSNYSPKKLFSKAVCINIPMEQMNSSTKPLCAPLQITPSSSLVTLSQRFTAQSSQAETLNSTLLPISMMKSNICPTQNFASRSSASTYPTGLSMTSCPPSRSSLSKDVCVNSKTSVDHSPSSDQSEMAIASSTKDIVRTSASIPLSKTTDIPSPECTGLCSSIFSPFDGTLSLPIHASTDEKSSGQFASAVSSTRPFSGESNVPITTAKTPVSSASSLSKSNSSSTEAFVSTLEIKSFLTKPDAVERDDTTTRECSPNSVPTSISVLQSTHLSHVSPSSVQLLVCSDRVPSFCVVNSNECTDTIEENKDMTIL